MTNMEESFVRKHWAQLFNIIVGLFCIIIGISVDQPLLILAGVIPLFGAVLKCFKVKKYGSNGVDNPKDHER